MAREQRRDNKQIDVKQVVDYLNGAFSKASEPFGPRSKAVVGTALYQHQVDFAYLIDDIERGPAYIRAKKIQEANDLIAQMSAEAESTDNA